MFISSSNSYLIKLNIANLVVDLELTNPQVAQRLENRYQQFLGSDEPAIFTISVQTTPNAIFIPIKPGNWVIESDFQNDQITYRSFMEQGYVNVKTRKGFLEIDPRAEIENFLRVVYAWLCIHNNALLLHAGGVLRHQDGYGYIFFGPSGAGKSTSTGLSASQATVLSDDLVIISYQNNHCYLHGVPFKGTLGDAPRANQKAPLRAIFRLRQHNEHRVNPLLRTVAAAELAAASPFVAGTSRLHSQLLQICQQIVHRTNMLELQFKKDDGFWYAIDEYFSTLPQTTSANSR